MLRYVDKFKLRENVKLNSNVELVERVEDRYLVRYTQGSELKEDTFDYVVVATGRFSHGYIPTVEGLESFKASGGIAIHSADYKNIVEECRGKRILIVGGGMSAAEIASDIALVGRGRTRVVSISERQKYCVPFLTVNAVPSEAHIFTLLIGIANELLPYEENAQALKATIDKIVGSPESYGTPKPISENPLTAGLVISQEFLSLVTQGRIITKLANIKSIEGLKVNFVVKEGDEEIPSEEFDVIIFATGFNLSLPFLSPRIAEIIGYVPEGDGHLDLYEFTFHPKLPNFACVGLYNSIGSYFSQFELQARFISYVWGGIIPAPCKEVMEKTIAHFQKRREEKTLPPRYLLPLMVFRFARLIGADPLFTSNDETWATSFSRWPKPLLKGLWFGVITSNFFRLVGPESLPEEEVSKRLLNDWKVHGKRFLETEFTEEEQAILASIASVRKDDKMIEILK